MSTQDLTFLSTRIYGKDRPFSGYLKVSDGQIVSMGSGCPSDADAQVIDVGDSRVIPGLIDIHLHGFMGLDMGSGAEEDVRKIAKALAERGTTAFQSTCSTASREQFNRFLPITKNLVDAPVYGARVIGAHLEGPFLNVARKGAMAEEFIIPPNLELTQEWMELSDGTITQMTIAPEMPGAHEVIRYLATMGVTVSAGHTDATYDQMLEAFRAGVSLACHTFNAMRPLSHRAPGVPGAVLTDKGITCELIGDCLHVHPAVMRMVIELKGPDRVAVITDAARYAGLVPGIYDDGGRKVTIEPSGLARLPDGTISGSSATMVKCLQNLVRVVGVSFEDALRMTAETPARVAGVEGFKGALGVGKDADIVVLDDDYNVLWSMVEGEVQKSQVK